MLAGMEQAVELSERGGGVARGRGIDQIPDGLSAPAADDFLNLLGSDLRARRREKGELGEILIEEAKHRTSQIEQVLGCIHRNRDAVLRFAPGDDPFCDRSFVDVLALALLLWRPAVDLQARLIERFVKPRRCGPVIHVEHQHAGRSRFGT